MILKRKKQKMWEKKNKSTEFETTWEEGLQALTASTLSRSEA